MRAQISAMLLLVSNLIGLGLGTTAVALITDKVFGSPLAVGHSMTAVNALATSLAAVLLLFGCRHFSASLEREERHLRVSAETAEAPEAPEATLPRATQTAQ
jgi:hypothetical protein